MVYIFSSSTFINFPSETKHRHSFYRTGGDINTLILKGMSRLPCDSPMNSSSRDEMNRYSVPSLRRCVTEVPVSNCLTSRSRPFSTGDLDELRRASVSGYSQNSQGKWMYSIDVMGIDARTRRSSDSRLSRESDSYVIRRRFNDFKQLHEELSASGHLCVDRLPSLPYYGIVSYLQQLFSPREILEQRVQKLQEILEFINSSPILSLTEPYMKFIGKKPCSIDIGYVSLSSYEVPEHECNLKLVERLRGRTLSG